MTENLPAPVGPFQPIEMLSSGGQAQVWRASGPQGEVALKLARHDEGQVALVRETAALRKIGPQTGLPTLVDADPGGAWVALEMIRGENLRTWAAGRPFAEVVTALRYVGRVLHLAHEQGVVHGDLKPGNIMVDRRGRGSLLDFGVATISGEANPRFRGTLGYAAPEVLRGARATPRSDVYGFGVLLYVALTGRLPLDAPDPAALGYLPLVSLPPPPSAFRPEIPGMLDVLILSLLVRDPARRPADLQRVVRALKKVMDKPPAPPLTGMLPARDTLYRAVVGAADGEGRAVVVYGPPGSGRLTLIRDAVQAAQREGLEYLRTTDPAAVLSAMVQSKPPCVAVLRAQHEGTADLVRTLLESGAPGLALVHAVTPMPQLARLGAESLTPPPLSGDNVVRIAPFLVPDALRDRLDEDTCRRICRESAGLPAGVLGRLRAWVRHASHEPVGDLSHLPPEAKQVLDALEEEDTLPLPELAAKLEWNEHELLDQCEVLFAEELVAPAWDGAAIRRTF